jgi:hypothetical protein
MIDPTRHHGLDIVRALADEWALTEATPPEPSGQDSTGPSSHNSTRVSSTSER